MLNNRIYLAGAISHAPDFGYGWRMELTSTLENKGYSVWDPCLQQELNGIAPRELHKLKYKNYQEFLEQCSKVVEFDLGNLKKSSAVFCKIDDAVLKGAGTIGEITTCQVLGIPVYMWIDMEDWKTKLSGWILACATRRSPFLWTTIAENGNSTSLTSNLLY